MISPATVVLAVLPIYLLTLGGAVLRKLGVLRHDHDVGVMHVIFSVMLPCFILDKMLGSEVLRSAGVLFTGAGLGFSFIIIGLVVGYGTGKIIGLIPGNGIRTFALTSGCQNYGFLSIPAVEILWGSSAVAVLFVHNIGVEIALWSIGVMLMSGERGIRWKRLINGPIIAVVTGILLISLHLDDKINGPVREAMHMAGAGAFPLAIIMTGASIIDLVGSEKPSWKIIFASIVVRIIVIPAIIIVCAKHIPMAVEIRQVLLVQAAMPAAMTPILLARLYGGKSSVAVQIVVATTIVSIFSLPYIITFGIRYLNLTPITH
ncbi:AEC family transporter [Luteolibacter algae]|uniref:AEC family transporter n=1 Tax=Luteolibacter algae TaxID=454151 RepID=A0ABW5D8V4_9BACT